MPEGSDYLEIDDDFNEDNLAPVKPY